MQMTKLDSIVFYSNDNRMNDTVDFGVVYTA